MVGVDVVVTGECVWEMPRDDVYEMLIHFVRGRTARMEIGKREDSFLQPIAPGDGDDDGGGVERIAVEGAKRGGAYDTSAGRGDAMFRLWSA